MKRLFAPLALLALLLGGARRADAACGQTVSVSPGGLQAAINAANPAAVPGDFCIQMNSGTYNESILIANKTFNSTSDRFVISTAPVGAVIIAGTSGTSPIFDIQNASVTLQFITIKPAVSAPNIVMVSSMNVTISSVNIMDPSGLVSGAGVRTSTDYFTIQDSSVAMTNASSFGLVNLVNAGYMSILRSTITTSGNAQAVSISNWYNSSISSSYLQGVTGGLDMFQGYNNTIASTTMVSGSSGASLRIFTSSGNTVSQSFMLGTTGDGLEFYQGSSFNQVLKSTIAVNGPTNVAVLYAIGANNNNFIDQSYISNPAGLGLKNTTGQFNTVDRSTVVGGTGNASEGALWFQGSSATGNLFKRGVVLNPNGTGLYIESLSQYNVIDQSVITAGGATLAAALITSSSNTISNTSITNVAGDALYLSGVSSITVTGSTITATATSSIGLRLDNSMYNQISTSRLVNTAGSAGQLFNSSYNTIDHSTFTTAPGAAAFALLISSSSNNTISSSYLQHAGNNGAVLKINGGLSTNNTISGSTMAATGGIGTTVTGYESSMAQSTLLTGSVAQAVNSAGAHLFFSSTETIFQSTVTSVNSIGLFVDQSSNTSISLTKIDGMTGASVSQSTATFFNGGFLRGRALPALDLSHAVATTTVQGTILISTNPAVPALRAQGSANGLLKISASVDAQGNFDVLSGQLEAPGAALKFGRDATFSVPVSSAQVKGSTVSFNGSTFGLTVQRLNATVAGVGFDNVAVNVSSVVFLNNGFAANSFTDTVSGSTLAFQGGGPTTYAFQNLNVLGTPGSGLINVISTLPGNSYLFAVARSSISYARIQDSSASLPLIHANDGTSVNTAGNTNWNFLPFLSIGFAGQTFTETAGWTGAAATANTGFATATVRAISVGSTTVTNATFAVFLNSGDANEPNSYLQSLVSGTTTFTLKVPTAGAHTVQSTGTLAFGGTYQANVTVNPGPFTRLQVLLPGETAAPGATAGKTGTPNGQILNVPFAAQVRSVDQFWNLVSTGTDQVRINSIGGNFPQTANLVAGTTSFANVVYVSSSPSRTVVATDLTNGGILSSTSAVFGAFAATSSSPTVTIDFAPNSIQSTLGGGISGTAQDPAGVTTVQAALRQVGGNWFNFGTQTFSSVSPVFAGATLSNPNGLATSWIINLGDALLTNGSTYYVTAKATNASANVVVGETTFTFRTAGLVAGNAGDGQGAATAVPSLGTQACQILVASITVTAGSSGLQLGGAIALRLPDNWQRPNGEDVTFSPPTNPGFVHIISTTAYSLEFNPNAHGSAPLGDNWIVYNSSAAMTPGQPVTFVYKGFPGAGPQSVGTQVFAVMTQGSNSGNLKPISVQPSFSLNPGPASQIQFSPSDPLTVGNLQTSPTMQLLVTDNCGNSTNTAVALQASIGAGQNGVQDLTSIFYSSNGALIGLSGSQVSIPGNASASQGFYFVTGMGGGFENVFATATFPSNFSFAGRFVRVLGSSVSLSGVSVDSGTLVPGQVTTTIPGGSFLGAAFVNFTVSDPALRWEVIISTSNTTFFPELVHRFGAGNPGRQLSWPGIVETSFPQRFLPPGGPYYVKIRVEGGVVEDNTLSVSIAPSASIYGTLNSTGAFSYVQANGPGASYGNFAVASSTGYFQIFGLKAGARYNVVATTGTVNSGQFLRLTSSSNNVTALSAGTNIGAIPFPTPSLLRVRVQIPNSSPYEFWGGVNAHTQDYANNAFGTLHYSAGADKSDDGQQSFGSNASTWTVLGVLPGVYDVDLNLQQVGISSTVHNVTVAAGGMTDLAVALPRKTNVFGYVTIPSTTPFGTFVGVQGTKAGDQRPTVFGGTFINGTNNGVYLTSGIFSMYGLDPGSWTVRATAFGFASASRALYISSSADVGNQTSGGFDMTLSSGGRLTGTINLIGDSSVLPSLNNGPTSGGMDLFINAYSPTSFTNAGVQVHLSTSSSLASSTFSITGLDDATYFVNTFVQGAAPVQASAAVTGGAGNVVINVQVNNAKAFLTIKLPGTSVPLSEYHNVSLFQSGQGGPQLAQDLANGATLQYFASSATWQSPALGAGYYTFNAYYKKTGDFQTISLPLTNGTTAFATLDLSGSTFTITGTVALGADVNFNTAANSVSVSSIPGVLAYSPNVSFCMMGGALSTSTFHLELLPLDPFQGQYLKDPLQVQVATACAALTNFGNNNNIGGNSPNPLLAYIAPISPAGAFSFSGVPAGTYILRNPTDVDGDRNTDELPPVRQLLTISSNTTGLTFRLDKGVTVSGRLSLPPGVTATRPFLISLLDSTGSQIKSQNVNINNANSTTYSFDRVPDGTYAVRIDDFGFPRSYGARPLVVKIAGVSQANQDVTLVQTGIIKGKLSVQQTLAGSTTRQYLVINANNFNLLPKSFSITAEANPWFQGGQFSAQNNNCGVTAAGTSGNCNGFSLDANDQFVISGVLPGTYDVRYESYADPNDNSSINLVRSRSPGITVSEARTTDIGTVNLTSAIQIRGTVTDAVTGLPIANVTMRAKPSASGNGNHDNPDTTTDKSGKYTIVGLDPSVKLYDVYGGYRGDHANGDIPLYELKVKTGVDVTTTSVVDFALIPAPYVLSGRIVGIAGGPALLQPFSQNDNSDVKTPGAAIFLQKTSELPHDNPIADIQVGTDGDGFFKIPALTTATYKLVVASLGYSSLSRTLIISSASVDLGTLTLGRGGDLSGAIHKPDGTSPSPREVHFVAAVTNDLSELLVATLSKDKNTGTINGYSVAGFRPGVNYRLIFGNDGDAFSTPEEARSIVFSTTTESRTLDIVVRPSKPFAFAKVRKNGTSFTLAFELSQPLRQKTASDDDIATILSTFSALGTINSIELAANRSLITATYAPAVGESSFTLKLNGYSTLIDPDSLDPVNQEFVYLSTFTFFTGVDGFLKSNISNVNGGTLLVEGDNGKVAIPSGAFSVDASSSIEVTLQVSQESLSGASTNGYKGAAANLAALRTSGAAYPTEMLKAMAATPPAVNPFSGFYDILLPLGVRTALQKPVKMTVSYSTGTDPVTLNLYWYNSAANAYILQQDVTGGPRVIDTINHTITINVNHFSTFVLFNANVNVISGNSFPGSEIEAYNFPNPFDLTVKTVTSTHGAGTQTVRGTMIRFAVPSDVSGDGSIRIFNVAGERVRTISVGGINGGSYYYQAWDGRNDAGRDVASGVYIGQVKVGNKSKFFKMALIK